MRMTLKLPEGERKRQDRSVRRAEKRHCRARMLRVRGLIHRTSAVCANADTARGGKCLHNWKIRRFHARRQATWGMSASNVGTKGNAGNNFQPQGN